MVAQAAAQLGGLHILVNSGSPPGGSATATGPIETVVDEDLLHDFNVKYVGALRCARAVIPYLKEQGWGRIINISGTNARNAGNLSGGARNTSLVHFTKTLAVQLGRFGITVNCVHPGTTRTERTPRLLAARGKELGIDAADVEKTDFAHDSPRGNAIGRMVDAAEIAYVTAFLASDKAWAISGELIVATGGAGRSVLLLEQAGPRPLPAGRRENRHGEWAIRFNRAMREARLRGGDVGWGSAHTVRDGRLAPARRPRARVRSGVVAPPPRPPVRPGRCAAPRTPAPAARRPPTRRGTRPACGRRSCAGRRDTR